MKTLSSRTQCDHESVCSSVLVSIIDQTSGCHVQDGENTEKTFLLNMLLHLTDSSSVGNFCAIWTVQFSGECKSVTVRTAGHYQLCKLEQEVN